jgi:hypothetical protein
MSIDGLVSFLQPLTEDRPDQVLAHIEARTAQASKDFGKIDPSLFGCDPQDPQRARHSQASPTSLGSPRGFIDQEQIGAQEMSECNRLSLAEV